MSCELRQLTSLTADQGDVAGDALPLKALHQPSQNNALENGAVSAGVPLRPSLAGAPPAAAADQAGAQLHKRHGQNFAIAVTALQLRWWLSQGFPKTELRLAKSD